MRGRYLMANDRKYTARIVWDPNRVLLLKPRSRDELSKLFGADVIEIAIPALWDHEHDKVEGERNETDSWNDLEG